MTSPLATLRQNAPRIMASRFLEAHPGCFIQYFDDTPRKDPTKALSARTFNPVVARNKQRERCAVCFSLQAFADTRTKAGLLCYRNMGADIDLVPSHDRPLSPEEIDCRKDVYLSRCLLPFPLTPHWLIETRHGFHVVFRVQPQRDPAAIAEAEALNRRLVRALHGDPNATLLTQLLRVPGTLQFKDQAHPFLCRLLLDNAASIPPYPLAAVRSVLDARDALSEREPPRLPAGPPLPPMAPERSRWRDGLSGVPEGQRNATAASLVGKIVGRLPEELWETAGWGGLKEWNARNQDALPERELRTVFESITRRERTKRQEGTGSHAVSPASSDPKNDGEEPCSPAWPC